MAKVSVPNSPVTQAGEPTSPEWVHFFDEVADKTDVNADDFASAEDFIALQDKVTDAEEQVEIAIGFKFYVAFMPLGTSTPTINHNLGNEFPIIQAWWRAGATRSVFTINAWQAIDENSSKLYLSSSIGVAGNIYVVAFG